MHAKSRSTEVNSSCRGRLLRLVSASLDPFERRLSRALAVAAGATAVFKCSVQLLPVPFIQPIPLRALAVVGVAVVGIAAIAIRPVRIFTLHFDRCLRPIAKSSASHLVPINSHVMPNFARKDLARIGFIKSFPPLAARVPEESYKHRTKCAD